MTEDLNARLEAAQRAFHEAARGFSIANDALKSLNTIYDRLGWWNLFGRAKVLAAMKTNMACAERHLKKMEAAHCKLMLLAADVAVLLHERARSIVC